MKPVLRFQSRLIPRKSYRRPNRLLRIKPAAKLNFVFRPVRFGVKPQIKTRVNMNTETQSRAMANVAFLD